MDIQKINTHISIIIYLNVNKILVLFIMQKILFITTFNEKLYNITGKNLVSSFIQNTEDCDLLVCYEDIEFDNNSNRIFSYKINNSEYLNKWLEDNKNNIPELYGGTAKNDDERFLLDKKKGQSWARFRASKYFRKVAAMDYFLNTYKDDYDIAVVIDSDCIFKKTLKNKVLYDMLSDNTMLYFWSRYRQKLNRGPETGFTVYSKKNDGYKFMNVITDCFISGDFKKYEYWDDGFVIGKLIKENINNFKFKDIVGTTPHSTTRVMEIPHQPLYGIIHHFKNTHATPDELKWLA